ncbi:hypothetical protein C7B77_21360 [Chamaesiphon polymorphus CCALA 037]|uniref:Uncharacterized protein n=1 Tax=Chamaesiphon polymorphus CCALA 037 TaxID=2107692 RepID=A0A2T1G360_9CYAN|nr:hypothetical protein C7B77_21360 [Chamaesiphon polymorphus CCALA 037]
MADGMLIGDNLRPGEGFVPSSSRLLQIEPYPAATNQTSGTRHTSTNNQNVQGSLRGGTPPLNGGSGGSLPQIRVLQAPEMLDK